MMPSLERLIEAGFGLEQLLDFHWQLTLGGEALDPGEIDELAEAKRPLVRLRGRWVILDPALLAKLRRPPRTRMRATEALGAVLASRRRSTARPSRLSPGGRSPTWPSR